jgi:hypothetical protein
VPGQFSKYLFPHLTRGERALKMRSLLFVAVFCILVIAAVAGLFWFMNRHAKL